MYGLGPVLLPPSAMADGSHVPPAGEADIGSMGEYQMMDIRFDQFMKDAQSIGIHQEDEIMDVQDRVQRLEDKVTFLEAEVRQLRDWQGFWNEFLNFLWRMYENTFKQSLVRGGAPSGSYSAV